MHLSRLLAILLSLFFLCRAPYSGIFVSVVCVDRLPLDEVVVAELQRSVACGLVHALTVGGKLQRCSPCELRSHEVAACDSDFHSGVACLAHVAPHVERAGAVSSRLVWQTLLVDYVLRDGVIPVEGEADALLQQSEVKSEVGHVCLLPSQLVVAQREVVSAV